MLGESAAFLQELRHLKGDTAAAELAERIAGIGAFRVDQQAVRHAVGDRMVVGHQNRKTQLLRVGDLCGRYAAAVDCDNCLITALGNLTECFPVQSVALFKARWDIVSHTLRRHQIPQDMQHQAGRRNAVRIVITVDADAGALFDFLQYKIHPRICVCKQGWVIRPVRLLGEELCDLVLSCDAALM